MEGSAGQPAVSTVSSTIVFQAAHVVHCPVHLAWAAPHSMHVNIVAVLVMPATMHGGCHSNG